MTDSTWPGESQTKAETLLPEELIYLSCELGMYIDLKPINFNEYQPVIAGLFHRIGRCQIYAEVAGIDTIVTAVNQICATLHTLLNSINYEGAMADLRKVHTHFIAELADLKNKEQHGLISMGNYIEK